MSNREIAKAIFLAGVEIVKPGNLINRFVRIEGNDLINFFKEQLESQILLHFKEVLKKETSANNVFDTTEENSLG